MSLPPLQPIYILRGHTTAVHVLLFFRNNARLLSGDADGWVVIWDLATKRPVAVWRAHEGPLLGAREWNGRSGDGDKEEERIVTHGRDGRLCVWKLGENDEAELSKQLPLEDPSAYRKHPWLLHILDAPSLNFCGFACCSAPSKLTERPKPRKTDQHEEKSTQTAEEHTKNAEHSKYRNLENSLLIAIAGEQDSAIELHSLPASKRVAVIRAPAPQDTLKTGMVMALRILLRHNSSIVTVVAGYENGASYVYESVPSASLGHWNVIYHSRPHSQPILSLDIAPGGETFLTSGADALLAKHPLTPKKAREVRGVEDGVDKPMMEVQTKHAGQQGLVVRNDGKVLATAGWDARVRVYSGKTMKELAVLKWHKEGCYAVAFADVNVEKDVAEANNTKNLGEKSASTELTTRKLPLTVGEIRTAKAQSTHWLAAGSKDGKVSLWDIY